MEEGPEPQELMEQVESAHEQHGHEEHPSDPHSKQRNKHLKSAITAAILAVFAALGSLLSGHAANEAILLQTKSSDQWSYFQAKSTKSHLYENNKTLIEALMPLIAPGEKGADKESAAQAQMQAVIAKVDAKTKSYEQEGKEIEEKATELEKESGHEFAAHQSYSFSVACFQIGIVIASVSILVDSGALYAFSIAAGAAGIIFLGVGYFR